MTLPPFPLCRRSQGAEAQQDSFRRHQDELRSVLRKVRRITVASLFQSRDAVAYRCSLNCVFSPRTGTIATPLRCTARRSCGCGSSNSSRRSWWAEWQALVWGWEWALCPAQQFPERCRQCLGCPARPLQLLACLVRCLEWFLAIPLRGLECPFLEACRGRA